MYATKRRLEVLQRKGKLKTRPDLPRKGFGARKARFALLAEEKERSAQKPVAGEDNGRHQ